MFNLLSFFSKPRLNIPEKDPPAKPTEEKGKPKSGGTYLTEYAFNVKWQIMEERMNNVIVIITVAIAALVICFITLWFGYWQFASTSFNDYAQKAKDLNDQRYQFQQNEIDYLQRIASSSAKLK